MLIFPVGSRELASVFPFNARMMAGWKSWQKVNAEQLETPDGIKEGTKVGQDRKGRGFLGRIQGRVFLSFQLNSQVIDRRLLLFLFSFPG